MCMDRSYDLDVCFATKIRTPRKAHGYQGELQLEQQQTAELEAAAVGLTEVAQDAMGTEPW